MATIYEIRKANLKLLVQERDATSIALACGYSGPSYISQLCGKNATRPIKEDTARKIEQALALKSGWLDVERDPYGNAHQFASGLHTVGKTPPPVDIDHIVPKSALTMIDSERLDKIAEIVGQIVESTGRKVPPSKLIQFATFIYEMEIEDEERIRYFTEKLVRCAN